MKQKGVHSVDFTIVLSSQIEALTKHLVASQLAQANASQIQVLCCDFYGGEHVNGNCTIEVKSTEVQYTNFHKHNPYSNTYNPG